MMGAMTTHEAPMVADWPEWLTPEYGEIHDAIYDCFVDALSHCYSSADASGMDWTTGGWVSVTTSNIMAMLRRSGCPPPQIHRRADRVTIEDVETAWSQEICCDVCYDSGEITGPSLPCPDCGVHP